MTNAPTTRETADQPLNELLAKAVEHVKSMTPEERAAMFEAQKKAWIAAEMSIGDEGTRVVSGHRATADHSALIKSEIRTVSAMWSSPFRKGIVAGLKARLGRKPDKNPYQKNGPRGGRAHRSWSAGYAHGLVRRLPLPSAPNQAKEARE